jgi:basic amino acid/polyamine antiporter, APA family
VQPDELRRTLGPWTGIAIVVGTIIGGGIFLVPSAMVRAVGSPSTVFAVWVFGGVLTLFGALTYAELAAAIPDAGGTYTYLRVAYGPFFGFLYGWSESVIVRPASYAAFGAGFYRYLADFFPGLQQIAGVIPLPIGRGYEPLEIRYGQFVAIAVILFLSGVNYLGARTGGRVQIILTATKIGAIGGVILAGLFSGAASTDRLRSAAEPNPGGFAGFFVALVAALYAYDGWSNASLLGSEMKNPQKNLPLAFIAGTAATIGVYVLTNLAYFTVLSGTEVAASDRVAADMLRRVAGPTGAAIVSAAALISIFAALNGSILAGARVPYAMARDGNFFKFLARVHPTYGTPSASILALGLWSSLLVLSGQYEELYTLVIFSSWILFAMAVAGVIVLRQRQPNLPRPYRTWGYPVVPVVFVLVTFALLYSIFRTSPRESGIGLGFLLAGLPFYFHWKGRVSEDHRRG